MSKDSCTGIGGSETRTAAASTASRPDFFIAGAAKCGTTALFEYLAQHPGVFMPRIKEPKFFCSDLKTTGGVYDDKAYRALFAAAPQGCTTGEASTLYLYSCVAIQRIMAHNRQAKIVVMLRHPVDAAYSLHAARRCYGHENIADFEQAWRLQAARLSGKHLPPRWPDPATLQYGAIYSYASQVQRLLEHVPAGQRHIAVYEEFFADPHRHYRALLDFLLLEPQPRLGFQVVNPALALRSQRLDRWMRTPPGWLRIAYSPLRPLLHRAGLHPGRAVRALNVFPQKKPPLRPAFRAELERYFADDVAALEALLGRRLWRPVS